ncbi:MAG: response regulator, partial [Treponema sp.]|nr:response regulator [Treponema sp.]
MFDGLRVKNEIRAFGSTDALCRELEAGVRYDLIFLDINFPKSAIDGAEAGRLIREAHNDHGVSIVYVSWEKERAVDLFETGPLDFLLKPLTLEKIEKVVKRYMARAGSRNGESFVYKKKHMEIRARIRDIVYFESRKREVLVFFDDDLVHNFLSMTVTSLITFIAALALQKFTHIKKDVIASPGILAFLFIIPLSSIVLAFFLAVTTNPMTFGGVLTSAIIFGINVIVFYLHDRLAAAHARNLETAWTRCSTEPPIP